MRPRYHFSHVTKRIYAQEDLDLYKRANWQRAVSLVLGMLMGGNEGGGYKAKTVRLGSAQWRKDADVDGGRLRG